MRCEDRSVSVEGRITLPDDLCELRGKKGRGEDAMQEVLLDAPRRDFSTPRHEAFRIDTRPPSSLYCRRTYLKVPHQTTARGGRHDDRIADEVS